MTLQPKTGYFLKLVDPLVSDEVGATTDHADVSTAALSFTASTDESRTRRNEAHWMGENKWNITDKSLYRAKGTTTWQDTGFPSGDVIRLYIGATTSCEYMDEDPPVPINTNIAVRAVPEDWPLVPTKLRVGDRFRLLFVTKGSRDATSADIATYNVFVQSQCTSGGVEAIQDYCSDFMVVGGTSSVSARDNTGTNWRLRGRRGLPVYWMNSDALSAGLVDAPYAPSAYMFPNLIQTPALAAPTYQIFYRWWLNRDRGVRSDGTQEDVSNLTVWTGADYDGSRSSLPLGDASLVKYGRPREELVYTAASPVDTQYSAHPSNVKPFYGISPIFKVVPATANAEVLPELTVTNVAAFESGDGTAVDFTFDVFLSFESDNEVTVYYETEDDTAEAGSDYTALPKTELTFAPGETRKQVTVKVLDDTIEDTGEIFYLKFSDPSGAVLDPNLDQGRATGMIFNAETETPEVSIAAGSAYAQEGAEAVFTLSRSGDAAEALTVPVTVAEEGSVLGTPVPESASFAAGATETELRVPTENDSLDEPDGTVTVTLAEAFDWQLAEGASSASVTVLDDDSLAVPPGDGVVLWSADMEVQEYAGVNLGAASADLFSNVGGTAGLQVKHLWYDASGRSIRLGFTGPVADAGVSTLYVGEVGYPFPENSSGESTFTFDDIDVDWTAGETLRARIVKPSNGAASSDATLSTLAVEDATLAPGFDAGVAVYRASVDSEKASVTVTAQANDSDATVVIGPETDADPDRDGRQVAAPIRDTVLTVTVTAADEKTQREYRVVLAPANPPVTVSFGASSYSAVEGGASAAVTVRLSRDPGEAVTVPLTATSAGGAAAGDFEAPSEVIFESGGALTRTATVTAVDDESAEDGESVVLGFGTLPAGMVADGVTSTSVALLDTAPNSAPTGRPDIVGDALVGEGLFAVVDRIDDANGLVDAVFAWQWLRSYGGSDTAIAGATGPAYTPVEGDVGRGIKVRVTYTDDDGYEESVTSEATAAVARPLTAHVVDVPESHDGKTAFTFGLRFSGKVDVTEEALRDSVFEVDRGVVRKVVPGVVHDPHSGSNYLGWRITVRPNSQETIEVVLPAGLDCTLAGAVCTNAGKRLHEGVQFRVPGPATVNLPPTGLPVIEGTAEVGETLTASADEIEDADGLTGATFAWQWLSNDGNTDTEIEGATGKTYTLAAADEGKTVKVRVTFTDDGETEETLTSEATAAAVLPLTASFEDVPESHDGSTAFTVELRFSEEVELSYRTLQGTGMEVTGGKVTSASRLEQGSNIGWEIVVEPETQETVAVALPADRACGTAGAICTDDGKRLSGRVEFRVAGPATVNSAPTGAPAIEGTARVGETLTASADGIADADGLTGAVFSWQWLAVDASAENASSETAIEGATEASYTLTEADAGKAVKVRVTFTDGLGTEESVTSEATESVAALAPGAPRELAVASLDDGEPVLALVWTAPESDGGSAITGYKVQWKSSSEEYDGTESSTRQAVVTDLDNLTYRIAGLTAGVEYTVRVMASNAVGDGAPAEATAAMADTLAATLSVGDAAPDPERFQVRVSFADAVSGLAVDELSATRVGGDAAAVSGLAEAEAGRAWTAAVATNGAGRYVVRVAAEAAEAGARRSTAAVLAVDVDAEGNAAAVSGPAVTEVTLAAESDGSWTDGDAVRVTLAFTEPVTVEKASGTPTIGLGLGGNARQASYVEGSETASLVFAYSATWDDGTVSAVSVTADSLALNGGTIGDAAGRDADLKHPGIGNETEPPETVAPAEPLTGFTLVDASSGSEVGALADGGEVTLDNPANGSFGVLVLTAADAVVGSVRLEFAGAKTASRTLNAAPWSLYGDENGAVLGGGLPAGAYTLTATAYGEADAGGDALQTLSVSFTVVAAETPPVEADVLTALFQDVPAEHGGPDSGTFTFRVFFNKEPAVSYMVLRDESFAVTGGTVRKAKRVDGRNDLREIHVAPAGWDDVAVTLAGGRACGTAGAICTAGGEVLSNTLSATIKGPVAIEVADARVREAADAVLEFEVSLSRTAGGPVSVDYATADGTAKAGEDFTAASGTLTFAAGETTKTVSVAVLDDAHDEGEETMKLLLSNATGGARIRDGEATGTIENSDPIPKAWLARFGRTVADQVLEAVQGRMAAPRVPGFQGQLAGHSLVGGGPGEDVLRGPEGERVPEELAEWIRGAADEDGSGARSFGGATRGDEFPGAHWQVPGVESRNVTERDLLAGTAFSLTGGSEDGGFGGLWGRGAISYFDGRDGDLSVDGEVLSAMFGADWTRGRGTAGLVLSHSRGNGGYSSPGGSGDIESALTGLYPWGRFALSRSVEVWGVVGYGSGDLTVTPEGNPGIDTDIDLSMAAAGARGTVVDGGDDGLTLAVTTDGMVVRTTSASVESTAGNLAGSEAKVTRLRLGLEGSRPVALEGGGALVPSFEIGLRQDGGDAETGMGAEFGAGLAWSDPERGISADLRGRGLLTHEDGGFREHGFAGSLAWDPRPDTALGPSLTLSQTVGASASGGMQALLGRESMAGFEVADDGETGLGRRLAATVGYGLPMFGDGFVGSPELGFGLDDASREVSLGWRLAEARSSGLVFGLDVVAARRESLLDEGGSERRYGVGFGWRLEGAPARGVAMDLRVEGARHESENGDAEPDYQAGLRLNVRW